MTKREKYRHKPTIIEAEECWTNGTLYLDGGKDGQIEFKMGDYKVIGIAGEEYIVKKEIFEKLYEEIC